MHVAICGGGIIGSSIAYYLSKVEPSPSITLIDRCEELCTASAKAGGFLAYDWCDGSPVGPLARKSFQLHAQLAKELDADIGYRTLDTLSASIKHHRRPTTSKSPAKRARVAAWEGLPQWCDAPTMKNVSTIGTQQTTAQVHPAKLTMALRAAAQARGVTIITGTCTGLQLAPHPVHNSNEQHTIHTEQQTPGVMEKTQRGVEKVHDSMLEHDGSMLRVQGVHVEGQGVVQADAVVLAMGPWTGHTAAWLEEAVVSRGGVHPLPQLASIMGMKAHSIVLQENPSSITPITPHALFLQYTDAHGTRHDPEIYPRPHGEVYVCGVMEDPAPPPDHPAEVCPTHGACAMLQQAAADVSNTLNTILENTMENTQSTGGVEYTQGVSSKHHAVLVQEQACLLPTSPDNAPLVGKVPGGVQGLYVAAGHGCWGILNGPATGLAMAELIVEGHAHSVDICGLDPGRFVKRLARR